MRKNWKLLCLVLLLAACKEKTTPLNAGSDTANRPIADTIGWGNGAAEIKNVGDTAKSDSVPEIEEVNPGFTEEDVVFTAEGKLEGFELKHLTANIKKEGIYEVRLLSSNPNLRFVFRENNLDSEANTAYWKGNLPSGTCFLKLFFNADAALGKEKSRYKLFIVKV
jgi:hypothetical protein